MTKPVKRKQAATANGKSTNTTTSTPSKLVEHQEPPLPGAFVHAPDSLHPLLSRLPAGHVYLLSLDHHPAQFKKRLFCVPLILNILLTLIVFYRIKTAFPTYLGIFLSTFGHGTVYDVDLHTIKTEQNTNVLSALIGIGFQRTFMFLGDFLLVRFIGQWPWEFFIGKGHIMGNARQKSEASPVAWRRKIGFRDHEIVVRRSRRWDAPLFLAPTSPDSDSSPTSNPTPIESLLIKNSTPAEIDRLSFMQTRILPGISPSYISGKTSYQMLDKSWDLFFSGMMEAHALVDRGVGDLSVYETCVLIPTETWGWIAWRV